VVAMRLPCGCKLGGEKNVYCPEATRLFVDFFYAELSARCAETQAYWLKYEKAKRAYDDHFINPKS
jgi:hypothetical protein